MRHILTDFVCLSHFSIGFFWFGLFFLPSSWWPDKTSFQFFFTVTIIGHQFVWGAFIKFRTGKFRPVCFLTTLTQRLRGLVLSDPKNYEHSFTREVFNKIGVPLPRVAVPALASIILAVATIQYLLYN
jgi:hypothetical protein